MKKMLILCGALLALSASTAMAAGINLSWGDCGLNGSSTRTFACATNNSSPTNAANYHVLVGSFVAPAGVTALTGEEMVLDLQSASATLPSWWNYGGGCRVSGDLAIVAFGDPGGGSCANYFGSNAAQGGFAYLVGFGGPNRARILMQAAVTPDVAGPVLAGEEQYSFGLQIKNTKTAGVGACTGCLEPVCIVFNSIRLTQPVGVGDFALSSPVDGTFAVWQGGTAQCAATPVKSSTWGQVKSLYR